MLYQLSYEVKLVRVGDIRGARHGWNLVHSTQKLTEIKPEIKKSQKKSVNFEIRNHSNDLKLHYYWTHSYKLHYKSTEIWLEIT
jgi:hypothetical protein